jgi:hypothetical protein
LDTDAIVRTAQRLDERISDRFEHRGISRLAAELVGIAKETERRVHDLRRPRWSIRVAAIVVVVVGALVLAFSLSQLRGAGRVDGVTEWLVIVENGIQDLVFLGIGLFFLVGAEGRLKRRPALRGLHELRSFAHVIDMHQLTKDPEAVLNPALAAEHSPTRTSDRFELARYLEYCSEMLSLTNKLAALYAQDSQDAVVLGAVRDVQELAGLLSGKIWQKIVILDTLVATDRRHDDGGRPPDS